MADDSELVDSSPFEAPFTDEIEDVLERLSGYLVDLYPEESTRPDMREPSLLYTLFNSIASEAVLQYAALNETLELAFAQTSRDGFLDLRGEELGITRLAATGSAGELRFMGDDGVTIPLGTTASTSTTVVGDETYTFSTTVESVVEALPSPVTEPTTAAGAAGQLTGDVVYKYVYVTALNTFDEARGFTEPSDASINLPVSLDSVDIEVPDLVGWAPDNPALEVVAVNIYRSYRLPGTAEYSEYKLVGVIDTNPETPATFNDDLTDSQFLLIEDTLPDGNTTGLVDVAAESVVGETGAGTNVASGTVELIDTEIPGIEAVSNAAAMTGGSDEETDTAYIERILEEAQKRAGAGNVADYVGWAKSVSGIYGATVVPEWNGPGTVRVVVSGADNAAIDSAAKVEEVRKLIAGTLAISDPTVAIPTATVNNAAGTLAAADYQYVYTYMNEGAGETLPSPELAAVATTTGGTSTVTLENIPVGPVGVGPQAASTVRIYRLEESDPAAVYELIKEVTNTDAGGGVIADVVDSGLAAVGGTPPGGNSTSLYDGLAPIGAHVTVETISRITVTVQASIVPASGYTLTGESGKTDLNAPVHASLTDYFNSLDPGVDIKYMDVLNAIHDTAGVEDFHTVTVTAPVVGAVSTNIAVADTNSVLYDANASTLTEV